jgi:predicted MFS family arabinose efflux permease
VSRSEAPGSARGPADLQVTVLGSLLCVAGAGILYVMPALLGHLMDVFHLTASQAGLLSGGESLAIATSSMLSGLFVHKMGRGALLASLAVCVVGDLAVDLVGDLKGLLTVRLLTGVLGEGPLYAMGYSVLGKASDPDRAYGWGILVLVAVSSVAMAGSAALGRIGPYGVAAPMVVSCFGAAAALAWLPRFDAPSPASAPAPAGGAGKSLWLLVGIGVWFAAPGLFWSFAVPVSAGHGVGQIAIDRALALSAALGLTGSLLPVVLGDRLGRAAPIVVSTAALCVAAAWAAAAADALSLTAALAIFSCAWNAATVYQLAALASVDASGRYTGLAAFAQLVGQAVGPIAGGVVIDRLGLGQVPLGVAVFAGPGAVIFLVIAVRAHNAARRPPIALASLETLIK